MRDDERDVLPSPKSAALASLYWRSEILQVMYWLRGEGFGDLVDTPMIEQFLGVHSEIGVTYLEQLVEQDYLVREGDWFALSELGIKEGAHARVAPKHGRSRPTLRRADLSLDRGDEPHRSGVLDRVATHAGSPGVAWHMMDWMEVLYEA